MTTKIKKLFKKCPFLILLVSTGLLFSLIGLYGQKNVYAGQEYDPLKEPALAVMFKGWKQDIYPWQIFDRESMQVMASGEGNAGGEDVMDQEDPEAPKDTDAALTAEDEAQSSGEAEESGNPGSGDPEEGTDADADGAEADHEAQERPQPDSGSGQGNVPDEGNASEESNVPETGSVPEGDNGSEESPAPGEGDASRESKEPLPPIEPLRESTREEYLNHISADIYGDAGVKRAAEYEFTQVDESYFDDALFIGDSRTVGLRDYTDLSEHADFYCETSLTIQKMLEENFPGLGTIEEALAKKEYGKIYIMLGINELGVGTTEDFMEKYTEGVAFLREKEPEAKIFIQGIMRVTGKKNSTDAIFNNSNINARNNAIATLADNEHIFYIDVNEVVCDEEGNLNSEYTFDQLHLLGVYDDLWKQFLLSHGVVTEE